MRTRFLCAIAVALTGCAGSPDADTPSVPGIYAVDDVARAHPAGDAPAAAHQIHRGPRCSLHVVQVTSELPWHRHDHSDETVVVYRGAGVMYIGDAATELVPGMVVHVPRGTAHRFQCTSAEAAVGVAVFTPPLRDGDRVPVDR